MPETVPEATKTPAEATETPQKVPETPPKAPETAPETSSADSSGEGNLMIDEDNGVGDPKGDKVGSTNRASRSRSGIQILK